MKKHIFVVLFIISLAALSACKEDSSFPDSPGSTAKERMSEPEFPLDRETLMKTVDELGLSCVISDDESRESLSRENTVYSNYVLRDPGRKYHEDGLDTVLYGGIISGIVDGNRYLSAIFDAKSHLVHDRPFAWEDWKQEIIFITVLYGGFEDKEEVYRALSKLEVPDDDNVLKWGVPLSNGYCGVQRSRISQSPAPGGYTLWINFYETEELYLKAEQEKKEAQKKVRENYKKRQDEPSEKQTEEAGEMSR